MTNDAALLQSTDPRVPRLLAAGWVVVGESWGARLVLGDDSSEAPYLRAIARVGDTGIPVSELPPSAAADVHALETSTNSDYPVTPATTHPLRDLAETEGLWSAGSRVFGARDGKILVGATVVTASNDRAETEFTSVLATHRRRGIGAAVKAASILALRNSGVRRFGTGGAAANAASLGVNRALGYEITERWLSLAGPSAPGQPLATPARSEG